MVFDILGELIHVLDPVEMLHLCKFTKKTAVKATRGSIKNTQDDIRIQSHVYR